MTAPNDHTTCDAFLGGRVHIRQPKNGYRAATDPVFLAASIPVKAGECVLELGCGVGVAIFCLGVRISGLSLTGLELQADYANLARHNARENNIDAQIVSGDLMQMPRELLDRSFDHMMFNPPFYDSTKVSAPKDAGKSQAHVMGMSLESWIDVALKRLKPKGRLSFIHRAEILPQALGCLVSVAGDITVKPLTSRHDQPTKRVIISCRKGAKGPSVLLSPLVVHKGRVHSSDAGTYSDIAQSILRDGKALRM
jgi:tRNA1(Val) A37 N6-methylase TrmN6